MYPKQTSLPLFAGRPWRLGRYLLLLFMVVGCNTHDERDVCCEEVTICFRYSKGAKDEFPHFIHTMSYFVFDEQGKLLHHIERKAGDGSKLQLLRLKKVEPGRYQVFAVGNATEWTDLWPTELGSITLPHFQLSVAHLFFQGMQVGNHNSQDKVKMGDSDPFYYGQLSYEVQPLVAAQRFLCDMSNAHARLIVTVRWADTQPKERSLPFRFELIDVPRYYALSQYYSIALSGNANGNTNYSLHSTADQVVHSFPKVWQDANHPLANHYKEAPYLAGRVRAELQTLRYTDTLVPELRITQGDHEVMAPIALKRAFKEFRWVIEQNIEQVYEIELTLYDDGRVEVRAGGQIQALDWVNGGVIG